MDRNVDLFDGRSGDVGVLQGALHRAGNVVLEGGVLLLAVERMLLPHKVGVSLPDEREGAATQHERTTVERLLHSFF